MEITREDLKGRYESLETEELVYIYDFRLNRYCKRRIAKRVGYTRYN